MDKWRQAKWPEKLVLEKGIGKGHVGYTVPYAEEVERIKKEHGLDPRKTLGKLRRDKLTLPSLSEVEVTRHYIRLSQMSYGVDVGPVPLGSCTMKYNPKISEQLVASSGLEALHPYQDEEEVQGLLEALYELQEWFRNITGMDSCSLQPPAGAAGELVGALIIRKYFAERGEERDEILVPDSAHGTNPASAAMAGFRVITLPSSEKGLVDLEALRSVASEKTAGIMLTNPNTLGLFEEDILEISEIVHSVGGLLYYDGANLNGILGITRPGDMGFDIVHLNVHKTFSAPHGGGGPGAGVVCVKKGLEDYLPRPLLVRRGSRYFWDYSCDKCIGRIRAFYGNIPPLLKSYIYIAMLGPEGLRNVAVQSALKTNYFIALIRDLKGVELPFDPERPRKHELVLSLKKLSEETGVRADDVAKALLDYGLHAPITYFPLIVEEALMIEFTESETKENIEFYARALREIIEKAYSDPDAVKRAPRNTSVARIDNVYANHPRTVTPSYRVYLRRKKGERIVL